ncbi:hypothetical protein ACWTU6_31050 [Mesorhizobium sp. BHbsci]
MATELIGHYRSVLEPVNVEIILYNYPPKAGIEVGVHASWDQPRIKAWDQTSSAGVSKALTREGCPSLYSDAVEFHADESISRCGSASASREAWCERLQ